MVNRSDQEGVVSIAATDDAGDRYPPVSLFIVAGETAHFNSGDLERGNASKGLTGSTGPGAGNWRLTLSGDMSFEALAYIRTAAMKTLRGSTAGEVPAAMLRGCPTGSATGSPPPSEPRPWAGRGLPPARCGCRLDVVMYRSYESDASVRFYWYDDRIKGVVVAPEDLLDGATRRSVPVIRRILVDGAGVRGGRCFYAGS